MQNPQQILYINEQKKSHDGLMVHQNEPWEGWGCTVGYNACREHTEL